ncbi:hypothetical protein N9X17_01050 [Porticoccaceae bacterium]|nr:hypothetical protein [Porticoccaceae bacterium]
MISEDTVIRDDLDDDITLILQAMSKDSTWTSKKSALREKLVSMLWKRHYISFTGSPRKYYGYCIGDSYLYDVPLYKQGWLKRFRGKRVRIVCVGSGRYERDYMAGAVASTPKELVVEKLIHTYEFPSYVSSGEIVYKTRRFLVFKPEKSLEILTAKEPDGYVDLKEWSLILIDGKDSLPKGKLKPNDDGSITCGLLGWKGNHQAPNLREAAAYLADTIMRWG